MNTGVMRFSVWDNKQRCWSHIKGYSADYGVRWSGATQRASLQLYRERHHSVFLWWEIMWHLNIIALIKALCFICLFWCSQNRFGYCRRWSYNSPEQERKKLRRCFCAVCHKGNGWKGIKERQRCHWKQVGISSNTWRKRMHIVFQEYVCVFPLKLLNMFAQLSLNESFKGYVYATTILLKSEMFFLCIFPCTP